MHWTGEDIHCRCCLLQRARWAVSEEYYDKWDGEKRELVRVEAKTYNEFKEDIANIIKTSKDIPVKMGKLEQWLGTKHCEAITQQSQQATQKIKEAWNACVDDFKILSTTYNGIACYSPTKRGISININDIDKDKMFDFGRGVEVYNKAYGTLFHEFGHNMSAIAAKRNGGYSWQDFADIFHSKKYSISAISSDDMLGYTLTEMLKKEGADYVNGIWESLKREAVLNGMNRSNVRKYEAYNVVKQEIAKLSCIEAADISDIWEEITNGLVKGCAGHLSVDSQYWKKVSVGTEAFAEMTDATINNTESLIQIKRYFPKSYEIYLEMLEEIGKGTI